MKTYYVFLICLSLLGTPQTMLSILDVMPWFIIENTTDNTLPCEIDLIVASNNDIAIQISSLNPECQYEVEQLKDDYTVFNVCIKFTAPAFQKLIFYPIFFVDDDAILPSITSFKFLTKKTGTFHTFAIYEALQRHIKIISSINDEFGIIKKQIPLHNRILALLYNISQNVLGKLYTKEK